jgi:hypothetical protein
MQFGRSRQAPHLTHAALADRRSSRRSPLGITQIVEVGTQLAALLVAAWPDVQSTTGPLDPLIDYHFVR